jgi:histidinol phosphatase-like enzyme
MNVQDKSNPVIVNIGTHKKSNKPKATFTVAPVTSLTKFYNNKINSCKSRKIEFKLTKAQVGELLKVEYCAYTGIKLTRTGSDNVRKPTDLTLERVDCEEGYTMKNTIVVCYAANSVKAALETNFRSEANSVIHGISETLKRIEAKDKPVVHVQHNVVQKAVLWLGKRVGL